jgi:hypothetical protein
MDLAAYAQVRLCARSRTPHEDPTRARQLQAVNSRASSSASLISGGIGHVMPITFARATNSPTVDLPIPVALLTCRMLSLCSCVRQAQHFAFLIDTLFVGIGYPHRFC